MTTSSSPLLEVQHLSVGFTSEGSTLTAVRDVTLEVRPHEFFSLVGESGSGKSVTVMTAMGLLDANGYVEQGCIRYDGQMLLDNKTPRRRWRRPGDMAMIFQYPIVSLNPVRTIGLQLREKVRIRDPERCLDAYPFELSGGMCQRVLIAMSLARRPRLLFADEPTTGLDALTQDTILKLLRDMMDETGMSILFITHDLGLAVQYSDRIGVIRHGELLETGLPGDLLSHPSHPYTKRLFASTPSLMTSLDDIRRLGPVEADS